MQIPSLNLQSFSGAAGVGAVVFVDFVIIANAFANNLFPAINLFAETPTWAIVVAVPLLSLVYLIGVLSIGTGEALLIRFRYGSTANLVDDILSLTACSDLVATRYQQLRQEAELLAGSFVAFTLLSFGSALHAWQIAGWRRFLISVSLAALIFAAGSVAIALRRYSSAHRIAAASQSSH